MQFSLSLTITMAAFGIFNPKSIWDKYQFYVPWSKNSEKIKALIKCQIQKLIIALVPLFFLIFTCWYVSKIEIRLEQFLDKNPKKQPLCYVCAKLTLPLAIQNVCTSNKRKRQQVDIQSQFPFFLIWCTKKSSDLNNQYFFSVYTKLSRYSTTLGF